MKEAAVCHWYTFRPEEQAREPRVVRRNAQGEEIQETAASIYIDAIEVSRALEMDDPSILELKFDQPEGHTRTNTGFSYHCTAPGTVVVRFRRFFDLQRWEWRWVRIVCREDYGWPWEWVE